MKVLFTVITVVAIIAVGVVAMLAFGLGAWSVLVWVDEPWGSIALVGAILLVIGGLVWAGTALARRMKIPRALAAVVGVAGPCGYVVTLMGSVSDFLGTLIVTLPTLVGAVAGVALALRSRPADSPKRPTDVVVPQR